MQSGAADAWWMIVYRVPRLPNGTAPKTRAHRRGTSIRRKLLAVSKYREQGGESRNLCGPRLRHPWQQLGSGPGGCWWEQGHSFKLCCVYRQLRRQDHMTRTA